MSDNMTYTRLQQPLRCACETDAVVGRQLGRASATHEGIESVRLMRQDGPVMGRQNAYTTDTHDAPIVQGKIGQDCSAARKMKYTVMYNVPLYTPLHCMRPLKAAAGSPEGGGRPWGAHHE